MKQFLVSVDSASLRALLNDWMVSMLSRDQVGRVCFEMQIDCERLAGYDKRSKVESLTKHCERDLSRLLCVAFAIGKAKETV